MGLKEKLLKIQVELKAPKSKKNNFGGYSYRNCEDIYNAVKPLLEKYNATLNVRDEVELVGDRYYIKALATLADTETSEVLTNCAYAREQAEKKGMDLAQITGATSSYARKYALMGLFLIDDTFDPDTDEHAVQIGATPKAAKQTTATKANTATKTNTTTKATEKASAEQIATLNEIVKDKAAMLVYYGVERIEDLTAADAEKTITALKGAN